MRKNLAYIRSAAIIVGFVIAGTASVVPPQAYAQRLPDAGRAVSRADHRSRPADSGESEQGVTEHARALRGTVESVDIARGELTVTASNGRHTLVYFSSVSDPRHKQTALAELGVGDVILLTGRWRDDGTFVAIRVRILHHHEPLQGGSGTNPNGGGNGTSGSTPSNGSGNGSAPGSSNGSGNGASGQSNGSSSGPQFSASGPLETDTGTVVAVNSQEQSFTMQLVSGKQIVVVVGAPTQFSTRLGTFSNITPGAILSVTGWKQQGGSLSAQSVTGASVGG